MQRESKMLLKTTLGRMLRALLKRYAPTTWRRCKQGTVDEFFSAEDAGPSEAIQRKFWRKNTAMAAANSTDVFLGGLPERATGCDLSLKLRSGSSNITYLRCGVLSSIFALGKKIPPKYKKNYLWAFSLVPGLLTKGEHSDLAYCVGGDLASPTATQSARSRQQ